MVATAWLGRIRFMLMMPPRPSVRYRTHHSFGLTRTSGVLDDPRRTDPFSAMAPTTPVTRCPYCLKLHGTRLPDISAIASVDYYRCSACAQVWTSAKEQTPDVLSLTRHLPRSPSAA